MKFQHENEFIKIQKDKDTILLSATEITSTQAWDYFREDKEVFAYDIENEIQYPIVNASDIEDAIVNEHVLFINNQ